MKCDFKCQDETTSNLKVRALSNVADAKWEDLGNQEIRKRWRNRLICNREGVRLRSEGPRFQLQHGHGQCAFSAFCLSLNKTSLGFKLAKIAKVKGKGDSPVSIFYAHTRLKENLDLIPQVFWALTWQGAELKLNIKTLKVPTKRWKTGRKGIKEESDSAH